MEVLHFIDPSPFTINHLIGPSFCALCTSGAFAQVWIHPVARPGPPKEVSRVTLTLLQRVKHLWDAEGAMLVLLHFYSGILGSKLIVCSTKSCEYVQGIKIFIEGIYHCHWSDKWIHEGIYHCLGTVPQPHTMPLLDDAIIPLWVVLTSLWRPSYRLIFILSVAIKAALPKQNRNIRKKFRLFKEKLEGKVALLFGKIEIPLSWQ